MTVNVTNGVVNFLRRLKTGDYEHKEASASLSFNVDGETAVLEAEIERIGRMAFDKVHVMLGLAAPLAAKVEKVAAKVETAIVADVAAVEADVAAVVGEVKRGRGRPPGKKSDAVVTPSVPDPAAIEEPPAPPPVANDLGALLDLALNPEPERVPVPPPITDADLIQAITRKNGEVKNPSAIKAVIASFAGPIPKTVRDIPQHKRPDFLCELNEVKPIA